jgi:hypothetical protein
MTKSILSCCHEEPDDFSVEKNCVEYYSEFETDRSDMEHGGGPCFVYGSFCNDCLNRKWLQKAIRKARKMRCKENNHAI